VHCEAHKIGFMPYSPPEAGKLAEPGGPVAAIAQRYGATQPSWRSPRCSGRSPVILPFPGTGSVAHVEEMSPPPRCASDDEEVHAISLSVAQSARQAADSHAVVEGSSSLPLAERSGSVQDARSKQQGRRFPLFIFEIVTSTRRLRVSAFLVAFTQRTHSQRAIGVMSRQSAWIF
jgi:hypothetical protein